nr:MAG TPA: hypothetical protein [Microviridae sp.]
MKVIKGVPCVYVSHGEGFKNVINLWCNQKKLLYYESD